MSDLQGFDDIDPDKQQQTTKKKQRKPMTGNGYLKLLKAYKQNKVIASIESKKAKRPFVTLEYLMQDVDMPNASVTIVEIGKK